MASLFHDSIVQNGQSSGKHEIVSYYPTGSLSMLKSLFSSRMHIERSCCIPDFRDTPIHLEEVNYRLFNISIKKEEPVKGIFFLFLLISSTLEVQEEYDRKYLTAIIHLKTDLEINNTIKKAFPKVTRKRHRIVEFNLTDKIFYLGIYYLRSRLKDSKIQMDEKLMRDWRYHEQVYGFKPFEITSLNRLVPESDANLFLTFSKPIDNYLVADMTLLDPVKYGFSGPVLHLFFDFDDNDIVKNLIYATGHYN